MVTGVAQSKSWGMVKPGFCPGGFSPKGHTSLGCEMGEWMVPAVKCSAHIGCDLTLRFRERD